MWLCYVNSNHLRLPYAPLMGIQDRNISVDCPENVCSTKYFNNLICSAQQPWTVIVHSILTVYYCYCLTWSASLNAARGQQSTLLPASAAELVSIYLMKIKMRWYNGARFMKGQYILVEYGNSQGEYINYIR